MKILVTGGAGFIGRWVVEHLLAKQLDVWVLDDLSQGEEENLAELYPNPHFKKFIRGDVRRRDLLNQIFQEDFDLCLHLAATISVQESLDNPREAFETNVGGTFNLLEEARTTNTRFVLVSTCMVYQFVQGNSPIDENHPLLPLSPYASSKLAAENLTLSYYYAYHLPTVVLRPFNTYGPFQKGGGEGGVISTFLEQKLRNQPLHIYGDGTQTRDFLYVEDCADFIVKASLGEKACGQILNAGSGKDISIAKLASLIANESSPVRHVPHQHPQSEIQKMVCDFTKAKTLLGWKSAVSLEQGIIHTGKWIKKITTAKENPEW